MNAEAAQKRELNKQLRAALEHCSAPCACARRPNLRGPRQQRPRMSPAAWRAAALDAHAGPVHAAVLTAGPCRCDQGGAARPDADVPRATPDVSWLYVTAAGQSGLKDELRELRPPCGPAPVGSCGWAASPGTQALSNKSRAANPSCKVSLPVNCLFVSLSRRVRRLSSCSRGCFTLSPCPGRDVLASRHAPWWAESLVRTRACASAQVCRSWTDRCSSLGGLLLVSVRAVV